MIPENLGEVTNGHSEEAGKSSASLNIVRNGSDGTAVTDKRTDQRESVANGQ